MRSSWKVLILIGLALPVVACGRPESEEFPMHGSLEIVETGEVLEISSEENSIAQNVWSHRAQKLVFKVVASAEVSVVPEEWGSREEEVGVPPTMALAIFFRSGIGLARDANSLGLEDLDATDGFVPLESLADWSHSLGAAANEPAGCPVSGLSDPEGAEIEIVGDPPEFETITIRVDNTCQRGEFVITR